MVDNGQILPMYEEVRRKLYFSYQDMKKQNSFLQISTNKSQVKMRTLEFRKRFLNFYPDLVPYRNRFQNAAQFRYVSHYYHNNKDITPKVANNITHISSQVLKYLGVSDIQFKKQQSSIPMA